MSLIQLPTDLLEVVCEYIGDPVTYFRLRGTCRACVSALNPELTVSMECLEYLQDNYYRVLEPQFDCKFRLSDPFSSESALRVLNHSDYQVVQFFKNFSVDEMRGKLSIHEVEECLATLRDIKDLPGCEKLIQSVVDIQDLAGPCIFDLLLLGHFEIVDIMLRRGLILTKTPQRPSLLGAIIVGGGNLRTVEYLLSRNVSLGEVNLEDILLLASDCDPAVVAFVLREQKARNIVRASSEYTHQAVIAGNMELLELLLKCGAAIDASECIAHSIWIPVTRYLVEEHGADINYVNTNGDCALRNLCNLPDGVTRFPSLVTLGAKMTPQIAHEALLTALDAEKPMKVLKQLLELGIDVNSLDQTSKLSVFHHALSDPYLEKEAQFLVENKADIQSAVGPEGCTPLMLAAMAPSAAIVDLLLRHGARIDPVDRMGLNVFAYGEMAGDVTVMHCLLRHRENLKKETQSKNTNNNTKTPVVRPHDRGQ